MTQDRIIDSHIINIVQAQDIHEQADLQEILKKRGYDIPQATLSRRLKKLKIAKVEGCYRVVEFNQPSIPPVLNIQVSEYGMIVLHTQPGNANSLAYHLDKKYVSFSRQSESAFGILGTIAGDDTVLLIIQSKKDLPKVLELLKEEFPYLGLSD